MVRLELIVKNLKASRRMRSHLLKNHSPHSEVRYYDGMIRIYENILKGDYNKK